MAARYVVEHLNHWGIVAEVGREIGVSAWLDSQVPASRQRVRYRWRMLSQQSAEQQNVTDEFWPAAFCSARPRRAPD